MVSFDTLKSVATFALSMLALLSAVGGLYFVKFQVDENTRQIEKLQRFYELNATIDQSQGQQLASIEPKLDYLSKSVDEIKALLRDKSKSN